MKKKAARRVEVAAKAQDVPKLRPLPIRNRKRASHRLFREIASHPISSATKPMKSRLVIHKQGRDSATKERKTTRGTSRVTQARLLGTSNLFRTMTSRHLQVKRSLCCNKRMLCCSMTGYQKSKSRGQLVMEHGGKCLRACRIPWCSRSIRKAKMSALRHLIIHRW